MSFLCLPNLDVLFASVNLVELDLICLSLKSIPSDMFSRLSSLKRIDLSENPLVKLKKNSFERLPDLEVLTLRACSISEIENGAFNGLDRLVELSLARNPICGSLVESKFTSLHNLCKLEKFTF